MNSNPVRTEEKCLVQKILSLKQHSFRKNERYVLNMPCYKSHQIRSKATFFFVPAIIIATTEDAKKIVFTCARLGPLALL